MKKILLAPDSFKGTFSSEEIAVLIRDALPAPFGKFCTIQVLADGGEGFADVFKPLPSAQVKYVQVQGPLDEKVTAEFVQLGHRAIIAISAAAGLPLVRGTLQPERATTFGVGELMLAAAQSGASELVLGLGGSATCDGGAGALQALGVSLLNATGQPIPLGNAGLALLATVDFSSLALPSSLSLVIAHDVHNPLLGPHGAVQVFGKQKGVRTEAMSDFEARLVHFADLAESHVGAQFRDVPGAGAAGGLGFGLMLLTPFLQSVKRISGFEFISQSVQLSEQILNSDLVITGEGKLDQTSFSGKVVGGVVQLCQRHRKPCVVIAGVSDLCAEDIKHFGIEQVFTIFDSMPSSLDLAKAETPHRLKRLLSNFTL
jgi:glycerate kinase